jgi:hypothetical protein
VLRSSKERRDRQIGGQVGRLHQDFTDSDGRPLRDEFLPLPLMRLVKGKKERGKREGSKNDQ